MARELTRVLCPGGWICARTPNRRGYIAVAARAVPDRLHARVLRRAADPPTRRVQPLRREEDVFDTVYRLNTPADIAEHFPEVRYEHIIYGWESEPAYFANFPSAAALVRFAGRLTPQTLRPTLLVFLHRRAGDVAD